MHNVTVSGGAPAVASVAVTAGAALRPGYYPIVFHAVGNTSAPRLLWLAIAKRKT